jgi:hypothetical protein
LSCFAGMRFVVSLLFLSGCTDRHREQVTTSTTAPTTVAYEKAVGSVAPSTVAPKITVGSVVGGSTGAPASVGSVSTQGPTAAASSAAPLTPSELVERFERVVGFEVEKLIQSLIEDEDARNDLLTRRSAPMNELIARVGGRARSLGIPSESVDAALARLANPLHLLMFIDFANLFQGVILARIGNNWIEEDMALSRSRSDLDMRIDRLASWPIKIVQKGLRLMKYSLNLVVDGSLRHTVPPSETDIDASVARYTESIKEVHKHVVKGYSPWGHGYEIQLIRALDAGFAAGWRLGDRGRLDRTFDMLIACMGELKSGMENAVMEIDAAVASGESVDMSALREAIATYPISGRCDAYLHESMREALSQLLSYADRATLKQLDMDWFNR